MTQPDTNATSEARREEASPAPREWRGDLLDFLRGLFDFEFHTIVTTQLLPVVYAVVVSAIGIAVAVHALRAFGESAASGMLWLLVLGPTVFIVLITTVRVFLEFVISFFRLAMLVEQVAGRTEVLEEITSVFPKIQFWRRWAKARPKAAPGS